MNTGEILIKKMKNKVIEILKISELNYQRTVIQTYLDWCDMHATSTNHLQLMLTNKALGNWFVKEYRRQEFLFLSEAKKFEGKVLQSRINDLYDMFTTRITHYPKPILFQTLIDSEQNIRLAYKEKFTNTNFILN